MSIFGAFGAVPSNFTVPLMVATVAGSIGVAAGAEAAGCSAVGLDCWSFLFLAARRQHQQCAQSQHDDVIPAQPVFLFMMSPFL